MSAVNSQSLSTALTVISANIEGLTASNASILSEKCKRERCHCICLQETHRSTNLSRPKLAGMSLIAERPHSKYGSAILIRDDMKVDNVYERVQGTVELITILMSGVVVHSVYKPPNDQFALPALDHRDLPHIITEIPIATVPHGVMTQQITMGKRLNSGQIHATSHSFMMLNCRTSSTVQNGRKATTQISSLHLVASRTCVRSQSWTLSRTPNNARSVFVSAHPVMVPQTIPFRRRFNFIKADWNGYSTELDKLIEDVEPIPANHKPRGCWT